MGHTETMGCADNTWGHVGTHTNMMFTSVVIVDFVTDRVGGGGLGDLNDWYVLCKHMCMYVDVHGPSMDMYMYMHVT